MTEEQTHHARTIAYLEEVTTNLLILTRQIDPYGENPHIHRVEHLATRALTHSTAMKERLNRGLSS